MRILIAEFRQESNSFGPIPSDLRFWRESGWILHPAEVRAAHAGTGSAIAGMLHVLETEVPDAEVVFGPAYYAQSGGTARDDVLDAFCAEAIEVIRAHDGFDALLFSFHGALQTDGFDDAEAEVVRRVREVAGEDVVIGASTDLHGFISRPLVEGLDVLCGYRTYPHVDFEETGARAARATLARLNPSAPDPLLAWAPVPMVVSASAYSTLEGEFAEIVAAGRALVEDGVVRDVSIYQMQPWLDVAEPSSTVIVLADDAAVAAEHAEDLAGRLWAARAAFESTTASIDEVIDLALDPVVARPVILVDSADSNNAGASGDSMAVAERLLARDGGPRSATVVNDVHAVALAHEIGVGATARFEIGATIDTTVPRIVAEGVVRTLSDGVFRPEVVGHTGDLVRVGRAAVISFGALDVMVCEHLAGNGDPQLYRAFGIEPTAYDLVVVKANTSFRAGYARIGGTIVPTDTPGAASADLRRLPFRRRRTPVHPFDVLDFTPQAWMPRGSRRRDRDRD